MQCPTVKTLVLSASVGLAAAAAFGQSGVAEQVKQRAKQLNEQNNIRQGLAAPAPPAQPHPPAATPPDPVLAATLQNIANLQREFSSLQTNSATKQPLINDLIAAAQSTRPSNRSVSKLVDDLATGFRGKHFSREQLHKLAQNTRAVFNSSHLSKRQETLILDEVQRILQDGGASSDDAARIVNDFKLIAAETK
jgi:hypothetical protein